MAKRTFIRKKLRDIPFGDLDEPVELIKRILKPSYSMTSHAMTREILETTDAWAMFVPISGNDLFNNVNIKEGTTHFVYFYYYELESLDHDIQIKDQYSNLYKVLHCENLDGKNNYWKVSAKFLGPNTTEANK